MRVRVLYEMGVIGLEAGMRNYTVELEDADNVAVDMSFDGAFFGVFLNF